MFSNIFNKLGTRSSSLLLSSSLRPFTSVAYSNPYPLPWPHHTQEPRPTDRLLQRLVGYFLLSKIIRKWGYVFDRREFLDGAKEAILSVTELLFSNERSKLDQLLQPKLFKAVNSSLSSLPPDSRGQLEIESISGLKLAKVMSVMGTAPPDDEHVVLWLGQKIVTPKSKMEEFRSPDSSKGLQITFKLGSEITLEAVNNRMEFFLTVSFLTKEKYMLLDKDEVVLEGTNKTRSGYHQWIFSSTVDWDNEDYPFSWRIYDINNYLSNNVINSKET